jgi:hypothetical protein
MDSAWHRRTHVYGAGPPKSPNGGIKSGGNWVASSLETDIIIDPEGTSRLEPEVGRVLRMSHLKLDAWKTLRHVLGVGLRTVPA